MNEIAFRRNHDWSMDADDLDSGYERVAEHELVASGEGDIQSDVETSLLQTLLADVRAVESAAGADDLVVVENEQTDYPKLRSTQRTIVVGFENRLHFTYTVAPPLRIGVYRRRS
jgi:hypothetical protein